MFDMKAPEAKGKVKIIKGGTLIDGNGGKPLKDPVIVLEGRRIKQVGTKNDIKIPARAEVIDCGKLTLMPGLMDVHLHTMMFNCLTFHNYRVSQWEITPRAAADVRAVPRPAVLRHGVHHAARSRAQFEPRAAHRPPVRRARLDQRRHRRRPAHVHRRLHHHHRLAPRPHPAARDAALRLPDRRRPVGAAESSRAPTCLAGCDIVKTCATGGGGTDKEEPDIRNMTQEEIDAIVDEAHAFHKVAAVHCFTPAGQRMALKAGADTIEHMVFHDDETVDMIAESGVWMTPTLLHRTDHAIQTRLDQGTSQFVINKMKALQPYCYETFQKMHKAGVNIALGTDMGYDPEMGTNARELEVYVKLGMTPMDAILSATRNGARALKMEKDLGTVEAGKFADIIAVDGDPLKNIAVLQEKKNIQIVMKEGRVYADRRPGNNKSVVNVKPGDWQIIDYL